MISRIRIEAFGASAAEVEATLHAAASVIYRSFDDTVPDAGEKLIPDGEQHIERDLVEPAGTVDAWKGRMLLHLNVASDSRQIGVLEAMGVEVSKFAWTEAEAAAVGGVPIR